MMDRGVARYCAGPARRPAIGRAGPEFRGVVVAPNVQAAVDNVVVVAVQTPIPQRLGGDTETGGGARIALVVVVVVVELRLAW